MTSIFVIDMFFINYSYSEQQQKLLLVMLTSANNGVPATYKNLIREVFATKYYDFKEPGCVTSAKPEHFRVKNNTY